MSTYIEEEVAHGGASVEIRIEVDDTGPDEGPWRSYSYGPQRGGDDAEASLAKRTFEKGMGLIRTCAEQVADTIGKVDKAISPDEVEVKFGVKLTGQAGALIAKKGAEAHMEVTLKWNRSTNAKPTNDTA